MEPSTTLIVAVLLGPVAAAYDFLTNPNAPPQIFAVQFEQAFGKPPPQVIPRPTPPKIHKRITVTRPS